jgi:hypothetical protein
VNILDENIPAPQRELLKSSRISVRQIGYDIARKGIQDDEIIPFLQQLRHPTFFTRDLGFFDRMLCHRGYCLVCMAVEKFEAAFFVRQVLRHPELDSQAKRMGVVVRASTKGLSVWRLHAQVSEYLDWPK